MVKRVTLLARPKLVKELSASSDIKNTAFGRRIPLTHRIELSNFLASIERRAFKQALYAVQNEETALDIVQDSMLRLAQHYGERPTEEWPMLFQRILQNAIRDSFRRSKVRSMWTTLLSSFTSDDDEDGDPLDTLASSEELAGQIEPPRQIERAQLLAIIENEVKKLPTRQREAFLLRYWEEMDISETAEAMGCTEGSVKQHCSRATKALAQALKLKGVSL